MFLGYIIGFVTGIVTMAFFYYRNKKKMDVIVEALKEEIKKLQNRVAGIG